MNEEALTAARAHARSSYPNEACGFVIDGVYHPVPNVHENPKEFFRVEASEWLKAKRRGNIDYFVHSHPDGEKTPSEADMAAQTATGVPWAIIATDGDRCTEPAIWGGPIAPLIGRPFVHGVTDCYALIRDAYRLGKDELRKQGVTEEWPYDPIELADVPRNDGWWNEEGKDLYVGNFERMGFVEVPFAEVKPGDIFFGKINSDRLNHGGLLIASDLIMHHLPMRVSRREPAGIWARHADMWVRYVGKADA